MIVYKDIFGQKQDKFLPLSRLMSNGNSSMNVQEEEDDCVWNKMCLTGRKWSHLNAPSTDITESHPIRVKISVIVRPT